jgi:hypothetical protein
LGKFFVIFWTKRIGKVLFSSVNSTTFAIFFARFQILKIGRKKREQKKSKTLHWYHGKNPNFWGTAACKYSILGLIKALWGKGVKSVKRRA